MRIDRFPAGTGAPGLRASLAILVLGCILPLAFVGACLIFHFYDSKLLEARGKLANPPRHN